MMLHIKKIILFILIVHSSQSFGQTMGLQQIINEMEENNLSLKAYENQIKSKDARVDGAGTWAAPMIGAGTFMSPYPGQGGINANERGSLMITAEQDIPNPAGIKARRAYLKTQSLTYFYGKTERLNQLRAAARQLYFDLLIAYKEQRLQEENLQIMQTIKKLADIRYPFNQGSLSQIFKAEGKVYEGENKILMTEGDIQSKKIALNSLMNRNPVADLKIDTTYSVDFNPIADLDTLYLAATRSDVLHMQHDIHAMEANIKQVKQEAKPDFKIRFDHMSNYSAMMPKQFTVMAMMTIPIAPWASKGYKSEINSMKFEITAMQQQKQAMLTEMYGMAKGVENEIINLQKQISNYEHKILPSLAKNLKVSMLSYQENKADLNLVIDSWETTNTAQTNYLAQLQKYYQLIVSYEKTIER